MNTGDSSHKAAENRRYASSSTLIAIISTKLRIRKTLSPHVSRNADLVIAFSKSVRIIRETDIRYNGPFLVILVDRTPVLTIEEHHEVKFNNRQVFPYTSFGCMHSGEKLLPTLHASLRKLSSNRSCQSYAVNQKEIPSVSITEVLLIKDPVHCFDITFQRIAHYF